MAENQVCGARLCPGLARPLRCLDALVGALLQEAEGHGGVRLCIDILVVQNLVGMCAQNVGGRNVHAGRRGDAFRRNDKAGQPDGHERIEPLRFAHG